MTKRISPNVAPFYGLLEVYRFIQLFFRRPDHNPRSKVRHGLEAAKWAKSSSWEESDLHLVRGLPFGGSL